MVYGARLESVLGASPHEFESRILRSGFICPLSHPLLLSKLCHRFCHRGVYTKGTLIKYGKGIERCTILLFLNFDGNAHR